MQSAALHLSRIHIESLTLFCHNGVALDRGPINQLGFHVPPGGRSELQKHKQGARTATILTSLARPNQNKASPRQTLGMRALTAPGSAHMQIQNTRWHFLVSGGLVIIIILPFQLMLKSHPHALDNFSGYFSNFRHFACRILYT